MKTMIFSAILLAASYSVCAQDVTVQNNRITKMYNNTAGINYSVALPVIQNNVPEDLVTKVINQYTSTIYGITKMRTSDNMDVYQVQLLENGNSKYLWVDANSNTVAFSFKAKEGKDVVTKRP